MPHTVPTIRCGRCPATTDDVKRDNWGTFDRHIWYCPRCFERIRDHDEKTQVRFSEVYDPFTR